LREGALNFALLHFNPFELVRVKNHPRSAEYMRARKKQILERQGEVNKGSVNEIVIFSRRWGPVSLANITISLTDPFMD
jgi:hypothetical protein